MPTNLYGLIEQRPGHPNFGKPFYIGIGTAARPRQHISQARGAHGCRNRLLNLVLREHFAIGAEPVIMTTAVFETRAEADAAERAAILEWGRLGEDEGGILCNIARGGDGPDPLLMQRPDIKARVVAAVRKRYLDPTARRVTGDASLKTWKDPAFRVRRADALRAAFDDLAVRKRISVSTKEALNAPEIRARHLAALARINSALTPDDRAAAQAKRSQESIQRSIAGLEAARRDPAIKAKRRANSREPQKNSWANPEIRARRVAAMKGKKKTMSPEAIAARQANARKPRTEKALAASRAATIRRWADPTAHERQSERLLAAWHGEERAADILEGKRRKAAERAAAAAAKEGDGG